LSLERGLERLYVWFRESRKAKQIRERPAEAEILCKRSEIMKGQIQYVRVPDFRGMLRIGLSLLMVTLPTQSGGAEAVDGQSAGSAQEQKVTPAEFKLLDGTPVKLQIKQSVSSADAAVSQPVAFEVSEAVLVNGIVVVPKGASAMGRVTEAVPKRRMGRAGKLEIVLEYVRLTDTDKVPVRAVKDAKGKGRTGAMTVGIVATGLLFWPAAPLFLLMHGKDITVPAGAEVTGYVNGDQKLEAVKFAPKTDSAGTVAAAATTPAEQSATGMAQVPATPSGAVTENMGSVNVQSNPGSAGVYADGTFLGNTPASLKLSPGEHRLRVAMDGYKEWTQTVTVQTGTEGKITANLEKQD
jgi:hypothetical protein